MESLSSSGGMVGATISYDQSAALTFHHTDYLLHAYVRYTQPQPTAQPAAAAAAQQQADAGAAAAAAASPYAHSPPMPILIIEAEQRSNGHRWTGEFSAKYIEEMSLKTGNFKKFSLFVRMLSSALGKTSETVFIDLLTFQDLEALKARKQQGAQAQAQVQQQRAQTAAVAQAQNKRYIILTYVAEFDKVHYPLPLKFETDPDPAMLKQTIARLRSEVELLRVNSSLGASAAAGGAQGPAPGPAVIEKYKAEIYRLAEENHRLKSLLAARGGAGGAGTGSSSGDDTQRATAALSPLEVEQLQIDLRAANARADRLLSENADLARKLSGLLSGLPAESLGLNLSLDNLSKQVWNLQAELAAEQGAHARARGKAAQEAEVMLAELEKRLEAERLLRAKCRALAARIEEMELAAPAQGQGLGRGVGAARSARGAGAGAAAAGLRGSGSSDSVRAGGALRRPVSASSPGRGGAAPPPRGTSAGRPLSRPPSRPGSRPNSRPASAASSRSSSPAPGVASAGRGSASGRATPTSGRAGAGAGAGAGGVRSRSPSPAAFGGSAGRFDPSAYVKHRQAQLAQQAARTSAHARDLRSSAGAAVGRAESPSGTGARRRSRSPVVRNGSTSARGSAGLSPRTSRSSSNASLSATSPSAGGALRHSQSQSARRSPAAASASTMGQPFARVRPGAGAAASAGADMPPRVPRARPASASVHGSRSNGHGHDEDDDEEDGARSPLSPRERERERRLAAAAASAAALDGRGDSEQDDATGSDRDADDRPHRRRGAHAHARRSEEDGFSSDEHSENVRLPAKPRGDNIEERFSALQNFLKQQKVDPLDS